MLSFWVKKNCLQSFSKFSFCVTVFYVYLPFQKFFSDVVRKFFDNSFVLWQQKTTIFSDEWNHEGLLHFVVSIKFFNIMWVLAKMFWRARTPRFPNLYQKMLKKSVLYLSLEILECARTQFSPRALLHDIEKIFGEEILLLRQNSTNPHDFTC